MLEIFMKKDKILYSYYFHIVMTDIFRIKHIDVGPILKQFKVEHRKQVAKGMSFQASTNLIFMKQIITGDKTCV